MNELVNGARGWLAVVRFAALPLTVTWQLATGIWDEAHKVAASRSAIPWQDGTDDYPRRHHG